MKSLLILTGGVFLFHSHAIATDGTWRQTAAGPFNWSDIANWNGEIIASGTDFTAYFTPNITATQTVNLDAPFTIGSIIFTDSTTSSHNLTISGANILTLDRSTGIPVIDVTQSGRILTISSAIAGTDGLQKDGAGELNLTGANTYNGGTTVTGGRLTVGAAAAAAVASGDVSLSGNAYLFLNSTNLTSSGGLNVGTGGGQIRVGKNNNATFADALTGGGNLTFNDAGGSGNVPIYNFNSTANTFSGGMTMNLADVRVNSLGDSAANNIVYNIAGSTFTLNTGAVSSLVFNNRSIELANVSGTLSNLSTTQSLVVNTDLVATGASAKVLTLNAAAGPTNIFSGNITDGTGGGTVGITKTGAGTWVLGSSTNSFTGGITVTAGNLSMKSISTGGSSVVLNGGTLDYTGSGHTTSRQFQIGPQSQGSGNGVILNNGTGALNFSATTFNISDPSTGGSAGTRNLTLGGSYEGGINQITGDIIANAGSALRDIAIFKTGSSTWSLGGTNSFVKGTTLSGGTLILDYTTNNTTKLSDTAALTLSGGKLTLSGGSHTEVVVSTTLTANTGSVINRTSGTSVLQMGAFTRGNASTITFSEDNIATTTSSNTNGILGTWATVGSNWAKNDGAGNIIALTAGEYTALPITAGTNTVNYQLSGSQLQTGNVSSYTVRISNTGNSDQLDLNTRQLNLGSGTGGLIYAGGFDNNYTISGTTGVIKSATVNNQIVLNVYQGTLTVNALLNNGTATTTKFGAGTLVVGGSNTSSGAFFVQDGVVRLTNNNAAGTTAGGITVQNTAALELANSVAIGAEALNISGTGISNAGALRNVASNTSSYAGVITIGTSGARINSDAGGDLTLTGGVVTSQFNNITFGGAGNTTVSTTAISGAGNLIKDGVGITTLTATNTYTGTTTVSAGTLLVNGSIATSNLTTVASGATIGGSGTIGALTVSSGGFINPGNSPGILNTGNFTQAGLYTAEIGGTTPGSGHDQINVTGTVDITGGSLTALFTSGTYANGNLIFILLNDGADAITGTYAGLAQGATVTSYGGFSWTISYTANFTGGTNTFTGGNDIALMAVPEPRVALLGCLGVLFLIVRRRR